MQSVSGLVLALLGRPPVPGDTVVWNGTRIEVIDIIGHGVADAVIQRV